MENKKNIAQIIKLERKKQRMSQQEMADLFGITRVTIANLESPTHGLPTIETIKSISGLDAQDQQWRRALVCRILTAVLGFQVEPVNGQGQNQS